MSYKEPRAISSEDIISTSNETQVFVSWTLPCERRNGLITGYQYNLTDVNGISVIHPGIVSDSQVVIGGLSCDTNYTFQVAAINGAGRGQYITTVASTTCCPRGDICFKYSLIICQVIRNRL